jgi:DNA-binding response OmpR family regulator
LRVLVVEDEAALARIIETVRGLGYRVESES